MRGGFGRDGATRGGRIGSRPWGDTLGGVRKRGKKKKKGGGRIGNVVVGGGFRFVPEKLKENAKNT